VKIGEATTLIGTPLIEWARPQSWCDLGCGRGTFIAALAHSLAPGSIIYAVDFDERALTEIPEHCDGVEIRKIVGDLRSSTLPPSGGRWDSHGERAALYSRTATPPEKATLGDRSLLDRGV
jgi:Methyltransferase domain